MTERYDVMTSRSYERDGVTKTAWTKIGTMFATEKGFRITFDALPVPSLYKGKIEIAASCFPPKPREDRGGAADDDSAPPF
jgi:hypothetical protein